MMMLPLPIEAIYQVPYAPGIHSYPVMCALYTPEAGFTPYSSVGLLFTMTKENFLAHVVVSAEDTNWQEGDYPQVKLPVKYVIVRNPAPMVNFLRAGTVPLYWDPFTFYNIWWLSGFQAQLTLGVPYSDIIVLLPPLDDYKAPQAKYGSMLVWRLYAPNFGLDLKNVAGVYSQPDFWWDLVLFEYTFELLRKPFLFISGLDIWGTNAAMFKNAPTEFFTSNAVCFKLPYFEISFIYRNVSKDFETYYGYWRYSAFLEQLYKNRYRYIRFVDLLSLNRAYEQAFTAFVSSKYGQAAASWLSAGQEGFFAEICPSFTFKSVTLNFYARYFGNWIFIPNVKLSLPHGISAVYATRFDEEFKFIHQFKFTVSVFPIGVELLARYSSLNIDDSAVDLKKLFDDTYWGEALYDQNFWKADNLVFLRIRGGF